MMHGQKNIKLYYNR